MLHLTIWVVFLLLKRRMNYLQHSSNQNKRRSELSQRVKLSDRSSQLQECKLSDKSVSEEVVRSRYLTKKVPIDSKKVHYSLLSRQDLIRKETMSPSKSSWRTRSLRWVQTVRVLTPNSQSAITQLRGVTLPTTTTKTINRRSPTLTILAFL